MRIELRFEKNMVFSVKGSFHLVPAPQNPSSRDMPNVGVDINCYVSFEAYNLELTLLYSTTTLILCKHNV